MGRYVSDGVGESSLNIVYFTDTQPGPSGWVPPGGSLVPSHLPSDSEEDKQEDPTTLEQFLNDDIVMWEGMAVME